ncbi:DMT family transporter [Hyalangium gracile]|uniref:DMT family transporter n=1 Tax=Hyalangium gracile TaxID=394092 RepID=UPI001CCE6045|nr:DMT family transporter [Hyalangium gracile]
MMEHRLGELFALVTACCWVASSFCFESAGRRMGSLVVNLVRLVLALGLLGMLCLVRRGMFLPLDAPASAWLWLSLSGVLGFFLSDMCLFRAFVLQGARRSMLMLSLAPVFAALLDVLVRRYPLSWFDLLGMTLTLAGVMWVTLERSGSDAPHTRRDKRQGAVLALLAAVAQALGATTAAHGMRLEDGGQYDAMAATFIRAVAGAVCFGLLIAALGWGRRLMAGLKDRQAMIAVSCGAVMGPVLGVTFFLESLQHVQSGVTQTIASTVPVLMLPVVYFQRQERIGLRSISGACVAVAGVVVLCLT